MLQLFIKFDIYVWLEWASPCPEDDSLRGSTHYENNWLLGSTMMGQKVPAGEGWRFSEVHCKS